MKHTRPNKLLAFLLTLVLTLQGILPSPALAEQRAVELDNHTAQSDGTTAIFDITIDGVDAPTAGAALDNTATVTAAGDITWEIPVIWVRDDLQIDGDTADEGHTYLPALAFYVPQGYMLEQDTFTVTLSDSLTALFGTHDIISVYDASKGITYIIPASLRDLFAQSYSQTATNAPATATAAQAASEQAISPVDVEPADDPADDDPADDDPTDDDPSLVEVHCAQTARDALTDEDLEWLLDLIINYLEPQAVNLLLDSFPSFREAADNGEIGQQISLYVYYRRGDDDGHPEHDTPANALAYISADAATVDGELKYCYMFAADVDSLLQRDGDGNPIVDAKTGRYKLVREGQALDTFMNTVVHELFHALMHDYNRTGMAGGTSLADIQTDSGGNFSSPAAERRYYTISFPKWFKEGTASAVENDYQFRYDSFQRFRRLQDSNDRWGLGDLNPVFTIPLLLSNYLNGYSSATELGYNDLTFAAGGNDSAGHEVDPDQARYVTGYLATLYLCDLAARYGQDGQSAVEVTNGVVTRVDSSRLRSGLDTMLRWMHEGATLDSVIQMISPRDANGQPIYTDTASFENRFIKGEEVSEDQFAGDIESQTFVTNLLNYFLYLDNQLPDGQHPNGSILQDFDRDYTAPLDASQQSSSDFLKIIDANGYVPSTVSSDTPAIGGGKTNPDQTSTQAAADDGQSDQEAAPLPQAAKTDNEAAPVPEPETASDEAEGEEDAQAEGDGEDEAVADDESEADGEEQAAADDEAEADGEEQAAADDEAEAETDEASSQDDPTAEEATTEEPATEEATTEEAQPEKQPAHEETAEAATEPTQKYAEE